MKRHLKVLGYSMIASVPMTAFLWSFGMFNGVNIFTVSTLNYWFILPTIILGVIALYVLEWVSIKCDRLDNNHDDNCVELIDGNDLTDEEREEIEQTLWRISERLRNEKENK